MAIKSGIKLIFSKAYPPTERKAEAGKEAHHFDSVASADRSHGLILNLEVHRLQPLF